MSKRSYSELKNLFIYFFYLGPYIPLRQTSFRIVTGFWCLMTLVLINAYASNLISYLTVPKLQPVIQSLQHLSSSRDLKLAIDANSVLAQRILTVSE